jgi:hypothetical protein
MSSVGVSVGNYLFWIRKVLMVTERAVGGLVRPEKIEEMDRELAKVIEEFGRAVSVETLYLAKKIGK